MKEKLPEIKVEVYPVKVRDVIKRIEADGWYLVTIKGDHRQFKHAEKKDGLQFQDTWGKKCLLGQCSVYSSKHT